MGAKLLRTQLLLLISWVTLGCDISVVALEEQRRKRPFLLVGGSEWGHALEMSRCFLLLFFEFCQS